MNKSNYQYNEELTDELIRVLLGYPRANAIEDALAMQEWWDTVAIPMKYTGKLKGTKKDIFKKYWGISPSILTKKLSLLNLIPELQEILKRPEADYTIFLGITQKPVEEQKELFAKIKDISLEKLTPGNIEAIYAEIAGNKKESLIRNKILQMSPYSKSPTSINRDKFKYSLRRL